MNQDTVMGWIEVFFWIGAFLFAFFGMPWRSIEPYAEWRDLFPTPLSKEGDEE